MSKNHKGEVLYALSELAQILKTDSEKITEFLAATKFDAVVIVNGSRYIKSENLAHFFEEYFLYVGITPKYWDLPEYLIKADSPWAATLVKMYQEKCAYPGSVSPSQGRLLRDLVCDLAPRNVLEIGCFIGVSTVWLASGSEEIKSDGVIHSVDLFESIMPWKAYSPGYLADPFEYALQAAASAQLSHRIKFYKMNSDELGRKFNEIIGEPNEV